MVDAYEGTSDETHAEFAARHQVEKATFERWLYLLRDERRERSADSKVRLLPVQIAVGHGEQQVVVGMGGGLGLRVAVGTEPSYVAALVTALRSQLGHDGVARGPGIVERERVGHDLHGAQAPKRLEDAGLGDLKHIGDLVGLEVRQGAEDGLVDERKQTNSTVVEEWVARGVAEHDARKEAK
jgi:hypothetical protein